MLGLQFRTTNAPPNLPFLLNFKYAPCLSNKVFPKNVPNPKPELELISFGIRNISESEIPFLKIIKKELIFFGLKIS